MIEAKQAYYIKLGQTSWGWEADSIASSKARIGWGQIPLEQIHAGEWGAIKTKIQSTAKNKASGSTDAHALEHFCVSTADDVWITFHKSCLWWGRLSDQPVVQDATSKYRGLSDGWHDRSVHGQVLASNSLPGRLSQLVGFRGTVCRVHEKALLLRVLNDQTSLEYQGLVAAREALAEKAASAVRNLHWKDFELLVDLVFRQSGWRRVSLLGETMKGIDLELEDPLAGDRYHVQVKSRASRAVATACRAEVGATGVRRFFLVVHSPASDLAHHDDLDDDSFQVLGPLELGRMVVGAGLTDWLLTRVA